MFEKSLISSVSKQFSKSHPLFPELSGTSKKFPCKIIVITGLSLLSARITWLLSAIVFWSVAAIWRWKARSSAHHRPDPSSAPLPAARSPARASISSSLSSPAFWWRLGGGSSGSGWPPASDSRPCTCPRTLQCSLRSSDWSFEQWAVRTGL